MWSSTVQLCMFKMIIIFLNSSQNWCGQWPETYNFIGVVLGDRLLGVLVAILAQQWTVPARLHHSPSLPLPAMLTSLCLGHVFCLSYCEPSFLWLNVNNAFWHTLGNRQPASWPTKLFLWNFMHPIIIIEQSQIYVTIGLLGPDSFPCLWANQCTLPLCCSLFTEKNEWCYHALGCWHHNIYGSNTIHQIHLKTTTASQTSFIFNGLHDWMGRNSWSLKIDWIYSIPLYSW